MALCVVQCRGVTGEVDTRTSNERTDLACEIREMAGSVSPLTDAEEALYRSGLVCHGASQTTSEPPGLLLAPDIPEASRWMK